MLKLFLVEDEIIMREGIKKHIDWKAENIEFVGEASDGELAYPLIKKTMPDIVITDIKMPFMDGLELSRLIKAEMPHVKIIILSGYDDFDYAKQAITIGVTDYLLKPISPMKLMEAITRVVEMLEREAEQNKFIALSEQEMNENKRMEKMKFFKQMKNNQLSLAEIIQQGKNLHMDLSAGFYGVCLCNIMQQGDNGVFYSNDIVEASGKIEQHSETLEKWYVFDRGTEGWIFLILGESKEEIQLKQQHFFEKLLKIMNEYSDLEFFIGVGNVVNRISHISQSYEEANKAYSFRYMSKPNQIVFYNKTDQLLLNIEELDFSNLNVGKIDRTVLNKFLKSGSKEEVKHFVWDYFTSIGMENMKSYLFRQYIVMDMYFGTVSFMESIGCSAECIYEKCGDLKNATKAIKTMEDTGDYLIKIILNALVLRDEISLKRYSIIINNAIEYIKNHFQKEDISLNHVSAAVNVSPNHFSSIFSQEMGETFIEYLTNMRMEKAKELLMCSNLKSSEIGYLVGYKDPHYFSFLFKKTQDCTPKEFRLRGKENDKRD